MNNSEEKVLILMSDDQSSSIAHQNETYHFVNEFNTPIEFTGDWELGVSEIDFYKIEKPNTSLITLSLKVVSFKHSLSDPIFEGELSVTPYSFPDGSLKNEKFEIHIPEHTEGFFELKKKFIEAYPKSKIFQYISFDYSLEYLKITCKPFEFPEGEYNYLVPDTSSDWSKAFHYKWHQLKDWRWYTLQESDGKVSQNIIGDLSAYGVTEDFLTSGHVFYEGAKLVFAIPDAEFDTSLRNSVSKFDQSYVNFADSASCQGALYIPGYVSNLYFKNKDLHIDGYRILEEDADLEPILLFDPESDAFSPMTDLTQLPVKEFYAKRKKWDIHDASDHWIVYCNVIEDSLVSNSLAPVLRVLPYNSWFNKSDNYHIEFYPVHYKRVISSRIESIRILIANTLGQFVPFGGRIRLVCKLRRVKNG